MQTRMPALSVLFVALVCAAGCKSTYDITLRNQTKITSIGKPIYDREHEVYRFKDARGEVHVVPAVSVYEIDAR